MRILFCYTLLFFLHFFCFAQEDKTDSLKKILTTLPDDTNKVITLNLLSRSYLDSSPIEVIRYATESKSLAEKIKYAKGLAISYKNIGIGNYMKGNYIEALQQYQQSLAIFDSISDRNGSANLHSNIGNIYFAQSDDEKALDHYLKALSIAEQVNDSLRIATVLINIGAIYGKKTATYDQAIAYDMRALGYCEKLEDNDAIGTISGNLGEIYFYKNNDSLALTFFERSLKAFQGSENVPYALNNLGRIFRKKGDFNSAVSYHSQAFEIARNLGAKLDMAQSLLELAKTYDKKGETKLALTTYLKALDFASLIKASTELKDIYEGLALVYSNLSDYGNAFKYQALLIGIKDTLYNIETDKKLGSLLFNYEIDKKENQINLLTKDKALQDANLQRQKVVKNVFIGGFAVVLLFAGVFLTQRNRISKEKKRSDELLLNILPEETAEELKATGKAKTKSFDMVTVMFTDFKNFTQASEKLSAEDLVAEINHCYSEFDKIITSHGIEKIKTIGDAYMCAGGLPVSNQTHPFDLVKAGLEMQQFILKNKEERISKDQPYFELRLGIHTGPVVAGIVGIKKFAYDIWGDTVNTASRMESSGETGKVNISGSTYEIVKDRFVCIHRGKVMAKNKGEIDMYFVEREV